MKGEQLMKKLFGVSLLLAALLALGACGSTEDAANDKDETEGADTEEVVKNEEVNKQEEEYDKPDPRLQEPTEDTVCEMCNMIVYEADHELGKFSAQAIKEDGSIAFYDDIGCLLNAELANNETNDKYVRDFNTLDWVLVEDTTIVKTDLKTPMNWGYAFFKNEDDAQSFIDENEGYYVEELQTVKDAAKKRREEKMKKQAEQQAEMQGEGMQHMHGQEDEHAHH